MTLIISSYLSSSGFRAYHSTQLKLWRVSELIHDGFSTSGVTGAIFLDMQKSFDKVVHDVPHFQTV